MNSFWRNYSIIILHEWMRREWNKCPAGSWAGRSEMLKLRQWLIEWTRAKNTLTECRLLSSPTIKEMSKLNWNRKHTHTHTATEDETQHKMFTPCRWQFLTWFSYIVIMLWLDCAPVPYRFNIDTSHNESRTTTMDIIVHWINIR